MLKMCYYFLHYVDASGEKKMIIARIHRLFAIITSLILVVTVYNCSDSSDLLIKGKNIEIHFDRQLHSKVVVTFNSQELQLGDFSPSEYVIIDGVEVKVTLAGDVLIFEYPSKEAMITYNLIQTADALKKKSTQMGLRSGKNMKFIINL